MEKIIPLSCFLVFGLPLLFASLYWLTDKSVSGIENFHPADCSLSLTANLFPDDNFLQEYSYIEGDYSYRYDGGILQSRAKAFALVRYAPDVYLKAKEFCLQQFSLCENHGFEIGAYTFFEHLCHTQPNSQGMQEAACKYPELFNMFAFNDSDCTLVFLGYYCDNENDETTMLAESDFHAF